MSRCRSTRSSRRPCILQGSRPTHREWNVALYGWQFCSYPNAGGTALLGSGMAEVRDVGSYRISDKKTDHQADETRT